MGGNDQWLSKQSIENESQESAPKVARAIPRVRKSNEGDAKKSSSDESSDEDETLADVSSRISPKKQLASKGGSMASKDTPIGSTKKKTPARKGAVATVPIRLTSGVESSSTDSPIVRFYVFIIKCCISSYAFSEFIIPKKACIYKFLKYVGADLHFLM